MTEKIKVTSLEIIVTMIKNEPYYEIMYMELGDSHYQTGYSSYNLNNVLSWKKDCFEIVNKNEVNVHETAERKADANKIIKQLGRLAYERYGNDGMGGEMVVNLEDAIEAVRKGNTGTTMKNSKWFLKSTLRTVRKFRTVLKKEKSQR